MWPIRPFLADDGALSSPIALLSNGRKVVLPRFGGHLKIGAVMRMEVSYVEEKAIQAVQPGVQA
jgi:hypothetical protein